MTLTIEKDRDGRYFIHLDDSIIGFIRYQGAVLDYIEIQPEYRGEGYGFEATKQFVEAARDDNFDYVVTSRVVCDPMEEIVRRLDFEPCTDEPDAYWILYL